MECDNNIEKLKKCNLMTFNILNLQQAKKFPWPT